MYYVLTRDIIMSTKQTDHFINPTLKSPTSWHGMTKQLYESGKLKTRLD
jgi:hypothetical protein